MINTAYNNGLRAALARFKLGNSMQGYAGASPTTGGVGAGTGAPPSPSTMTSPPVAPAAPAAAGATSARPLG
jgi:hypothetical protein